MDGSGTIDPDGHIKVDALKFPLDPDYLTPKIRKKLRLGRYDQGFLAAALEVVRPGDTVLELGSGLGFVTGMIAKQRDVAMIHGYDGNAAVVRYAEAMLATNGIQNVQLTNAVLGPRKSTVPFLLQSYAPLSSLLPFDGRESTSVTVDMINAKGAVKDIKPTVILCNIEGGEADVFKGVPLPTVRHTLIKLNPDRIGSAGIARVFEAMAVANLVYDPSISAGSLVGFVAK